VGTHPGTDHMNGRLARLADLAFRQRGHMLAGWVVLNTACHGQKRSGRRRPQSVPAGRSDR
jgi:hypothetical protein